MQVLPEEGTQGGGAQKDDGRSRCRQMRQEWQANRCQLTHGDRRDAAFLASEPCTESGEHHPDAADGPCALPESRWQSGVSADRQHGRTGTENSHGCVLLDSGCGLTSCPINYAGDLPLLSRPVNLPILSIATGGGVECNGLRQVGYRLENGEPFVATARRKCDELDHLH